MELPNENTLLREIIDRHAYGSENAFAKEIGINSTAINRLFRVDAKSDIDKRGYLTKKFAEFRELNNIDKSLTPYSFRHTYITKMYIKLRETMSKEETIKKLSLITGHESKAIFNYIHVNDIELPDDYSKLLK